AGLRAMGELMSAAHAVYSACGLGSAGTDRLVELVREAGEAAGLYGAKITGGRSGGAVALLGAAGAAGAGPEGGRRLRGRGRRGRAPSARCPGCAEAMSRGRAVTDELNLSMFRAYEIRTPSALLTPELAECLARAEACYIRSAQRS